MALAAYRQPKVTLVMAAAISVYLRSASVKLVPDLFCDQPTAVHLLGDEHETPPSSELPCRPEGSGASSTTQEVPFQCSASGLRSTLLLVK